MTREEKARAYDEALEKAREIKEKIMYSHLSTESCKAVSEYIDTIIPELAESEDERIRKELIEAFEVYDIESSWNLIPVKHILAWLEKQKEPRYAIRATKGFGDPDGPQFELVDLQKEQKVDIDKIRKDLYQSGYNDGYQHGKEDAQKEQKPAEWSDYKDKVNVPYCSSEPEWSEEDENKIERLAFLVSVVEEKEMISPSESIDLRNFIKSLRPPFKDREMKLKILK